MMRRAHAVLALLLLAAGCGGDGTSGGSGYGGGMTASAMRALPLFDAAGGLTRLPAWTRGAAGDAVGDDEAKNFFKLECHMPGQQNDCPEGIEADAGTKYTVTTLIGLIYHAEMKMKDVFREGYTGCAVGEGAGELAVSGASFVSEEGAGDKYTIDFYRLLGCVGHTSSPAVSYFAYGTSAEKWVMIDTRKHDLATEGWDQSDIWQVYLSREGAGQDRILGFNSVNLNDAADDYAGRALLLVNLATRKFLVKYGRMGGAYLTAAGKGGISASGLFEEGHYFVRSPQNPEGFCVDNATRAEADPSHCEAEAASWEGPEAVGSYLEMTAEEREDLSGFLSFFASGPTAENLPSGAYPTVAADVADFPDRIE